MTGGYAFRPCRGGDDQAAMAAVRLASVDRDGLDVDSVVDPVPTVVECADEQTLVEHNGVVVGYSVLSWWYERDGTWLYLHRGYLLPEHRGRGVGSDLLAWAENRIRELVVQQGTAAT